MWDWKRTTAWCLGLFVVGWILPHVFWTAYSEAEIATGRTLLVLMRWSCPPTILVSASGGVGAQSAEATLLNQAAVMNGGLYAGLGAVAFLSHARGMRLAWPALVLAAGWLAVVMWLHGGVW
jgi:hypothetical protein